MVQIIRKAALPLPLDLPESLRSAAAFAPSIRLREPRLAGFPLLFTADLELIEPAVAFLHEHAVQRAHTTDTLRTYAEILYDWFDTLEQNRIAWSVADAADLIAYRNRMLTQESAHTKRPYSIRTINHRVRGVLRFYEWAVRTGWLRASPLIGRSNDFAIARRARAPREARADDEDSRLLVLRQFASLPRPLTTAQARELLAALVPPYDLMARWQLYTGLRVSELLRLTVADVFRPTAASRGATQPAQRVIDVLRKGRKSGYVIASTSLLEETAGYVSAHRRAWQARAARTRGAVEQPVLFIGSRGTAVSKNRYQQVIHDAGLACGFKATTHLLRATFACMMLARLERLATQGASINPLLIVKVLMGHEHIETTDRYLRAIAVDTCVLSDVLDSLIDGAPG
jgi:site-specific recombinase XerD